MIGLSKFGDPEGRTGDLTNCDGVKIDPTRAEDTLLRLPGVSEAAAFGVADALGLDRAWAAIVTASPIALAAPELAALAAVRLVVAANCVSRRPPPCSPGAVRPEAQCALCLLRVDGAAGGQKQDN